MFDFGDLHEQLQAEKAEGVENAMMLSHEDRQELFRVLVKYMMKLPSGCQLEKDITRVAGHIARAHNKLNEGSLLDMSGDK